MAVNKTRLRVTELDFDDIKDNLKTYLKGQNQFNFNESNTSEKISHYINRIHNDHEPIYQNVGKTKSKMIKSKISTNIETKKRKAFLDKNSIYEIKDEKFLYFPLQTEPEAKILSISPFFSNQISVIENDASIGEVS